MTNQAGPSGAAVRSNFQLLAFAPALLCVLTLITVYSAHAQTFTVLHNFTGGGDGGTDPTAGLTMDRAGNLYGTASENGLGGSGTVFRLSFKSSGWVLDPLHSFTGGSDGARPLAGVIMDQAGNLYGTALLGGLAECDLYPGCGTVFELKPPETPCVTASCPWPETVLHTFTGGSDGSGPAEGDLIFDQAGNLYGTTESGGQPGCGDFGCGTVFELSPSGSGWTETVLYRFTGGSDGDGPYAGLVFDRAGNLYGTTGSGGVPNCGLYPGCGTVFELSPSGSGWTESVLYRFTGGNDGWLPAGGLIFDPAGNLYGTTPVGGESGAGTVFELSLSNGHWTKAILYSFTGESGPEDSLVMDGEGNLYGTSYAAGSRGGDAGVVFKLMPNASGQWTYTSLHDFLCTQRTCPDGSAPVGSVIFDPNGNLYGTTEGGGLSGSTNGSAEGVVWKITP